MFNNLKVGLSYNSFFDSFKKVFPTLEIVNDVNSVQDFDLIVFPGGEDVNPMNYGEKITFSSCVNNGRDADEIRIIKWISYLKDRDRKVPKVLGICRGSQVVNVGLGGNLYQDISIQCASFHNENHPIEPVNSFGEKIAKLFPGGVNSYHHQGIRMSGENIIVCALWRGVPEVSVSRDGNILLCQFHPEPNFMNQERAGMFWEFIDEWIKERKPNRIDQALRLNLNYDKHIFRKSLKDFAEYKFEIDAENDDNFLDVDEEEHE